MNGIGDYFDLALSIVRPMHTDAIRAAQRALHEVHPTRGDFDKAMQEMHPNRADFVIACAKAAQRIKIELKNAPVFQALDQCADRLLDAGRLLMRKRERLFAGAYDISDLMDGDGDNVVASGEDKSSPTNIDHHSCFQYTGRRATVRLALKASLDVQTARIGLPSGHVVHVGSVEDLAHWLDSTGKYGCWSLEDKGPYYLVVDFAEDGPGVIGLLQSCPKTDTHSPNTQQEDV